jgi:hypothetical protein
VSVKIRPEGYNHRCKECSQPSMAPRCFDCRGRAAWLVVVDLADADPVYPMGGLTWCPLCPNALKDGGAMANPDAHLEDCPWRRARELVG